MEKALADTLDYLRANVPDAFTSDQSPESDDVEPQPIDPDFAFWDTDGNSEATFLPDELRGPLLDDIRARRSRVEGPLTDSGVEALAWYRPYHSSRDRWGIYLKLDGIAYVAGEVLRAHGGGPLGLDLAIRAAPAALLRHEEFHCEVEIFATGPELAAGRPTYLPYNSYFRRAGAFRREEALANRRMVTQRWGKLGGATTRRAVEVVADAGPPSYRRWRDCLDAKAYDEAKSLLAGEIIDALV